MIVYTNQNSDEELKVKKTKKKNFIIKKSDKHQQKNQYIDVSINNDMYIKKFKGMNEYKLAEHIKKKYKIEVSAEYIRKVWSEGNSVLPKYNENGDKHPINPYKEII